MKNDSSNIFTDISSEEWRQYEFTDGARVTIKNPTHLSVSANGHRIFDAEGISHHITFP